MHLSSNRVSTRNRALPTCFLFPSHLRKSMRKERKGNAKVKTFQSQKHRGQIKKREKIRVNTPRSTQTLTLPMVAKSSTQLTNISMGITVYTIIRSHTDNMKLLIICTLCSIFCQCIYDYVPV